MEEKGGLEGGEPQQPLLPHEYEALTGGGAAEAQLVRQKLSRRKFLRRAVGGMLGLLMAEAVAGSLAMLYPNLAGQFGSPINVGPKSSFAPSSPQEVVLDSQGIFYRANAKAYIVHLGATTPFLLRGPQLRNQLDADWWVQDTDGTYWVVLYQKCVHLGCRIPFRDECHSFKCPCHGSHYHLDGAYLDGPAPRSLDRFLFRFEGEQVIIDTGKLNTAVGRPERQLRLLSPEGTECAL